MRIFQTTELNITKALDGVTLTFEQGYQNPLLSLPKGLSVLRTAGLPGIGGGSNECCTVWK